MKRPIPAADAGDQAASFGKENVAYRVSYIGRSEVVGANNQGASRSGIRQNSWMIRFAAWAFLAKSTT
ncbi:MAG: hypothetical protein MK329_13200 [Pirellulales bacterium]|nr:hypothetical protein [Pirellulales bacterium]